MRGLALVALIYGLLTIFAGGGVLYGPAAVTGWAGTTVAFVLWFNFLTGFVCLAAAWGLWRQRTWSVHLAGLITIANGAVLLILWAHIALGGAFEIRTPVAMSLRLLVWVFIYLSARRALSARRERTETA